MKHYLSLALAAIAITSACSSSSDGDANSQDGSLTATTLPNRVVSIETDIGKDGTIDVTSGMSYDADGRINQRTFDYSGDFASVDDIVKDYLYSGGKLVEIKTDDEVEMLTYVNDLLTDYLYTQVSFEEQKSFRYDDSGRLIGVTGQSGFFDDDYNCPFLLLGSSPDTEEFDTDESDLILLYSNNRLSSVGTGDGVFHQVYTYNGNNIVSINTFHSCDGLAAANSTNEDPDEIIEFRYDNNSLLQSVFRETFNDSRQTTVTRDDNGRPIQTRDEDFGSTETTTVTYNEQGLVSQVETTNEPPNQFFPDSISTISYEPQNCLVALTANPFKAAALLALRPATTDNDPAQCLFPLDERSF